MPEVSPKFHMEALAMAMIKRVQLFSKAKFWVPYTRHGWLIQDIPSGKRLHSYGKPPFLMGKSTINGNFQ